VSQLTPDFDTALANFAESMYNRRLSHVQAAEAIRADTPAYARADPAAVEARAEKEMKQAETLFLLESAARKGFLLLLTGAPQDNFLGVDIASEGPWKALYQEASKCSRLRAMKPSEAEAVLLGDDELATAD
jgi:hypothetical protein